MTESVLLELDGVGEVVVDPEASYVRISVQGDAADPGLRQLLEVAFEAVVARRLRYTVVDTSGITGRPSIEYLQRLEDMLPVMVRAGCRAQFSVLPRTSGLVGLNMRTFLAQQREHGIATFQVAAVVEAVRAIEELNRSEAVVGT